MKKIKVGFISLGCSKNQIDTEIMLAHLDSAGYTVVADETEADVIIINTCAFIEEAKKEAIDNILDVAWLKKNRDLKKIIVTGCLAERYREQVMEQMPEVDGMIGVGSIHNIAEAVETVLKNEAYTSFEDKEKLVLGGERMLTTPSYAAYIKIAEGCDNKCTYCAIPSIRGKFRSRTIEDIVSEAKLLDSDGCKELSLIAQDTSRYGLDIYGKYALVDLIRAICAETKIPWIRLLYCYPDKITDELVSEIANNPRVVKYIDIPIQHINKDVLSRMNRHGGPEIIKDAVKRLRDACPGIILRTTVIVGFPGETEEQFEELCEYVAETKFERLGAFVYSREEDTPAYDLDGQVDEQIKQDRYDKISALALDISEKQCKKYQGKTLTVLCEGYDGALGGYVGRSASEAPDVDGKIFFDVPSRPDKHAEGEFVQVKITETYEYDLFGKSVKGKKI